MAQIKGTNVAAPVVPFSDADVHPSHEAAFGKGGYRTVASIAARNAIPAPRREAGMLAYVQADGRVYQLGSDLAAWQEFKGEATSWAELAGKPDSFPPSAHAHTFLDVAGLAAALDSKQVAGSYAATVHQHVAADISDFSSAVAAVATPATLSGATDVAIQNILDGDVLRFENARWRNYREENLTDGGNF